MTDTTSQSDAMTHVLAGSVVSMGLGGALLLSYAGETMIAGALIGLVLTGAGFGAVIAGAYLRSRPEAAVTEAWSE